MRTLATAAVDQVGAEITLMGWINSRRDHGGLIFIDLRDHTGVVQLVVQPDNAEVFEMAGQLRDEYVISATGTVTEREEGLKNPNIATGTIEIKLNTLSILNRADVLPFQLHGEQNISEEQRLRYRFLDLRRDKMQIMLAKRSDMYKFMRKYMEEREFTEITTPIIANSSPEGARDFLIPSRIHPGKFYALPQAPQQFKQLLMVGGVPRYYQFAACFRDEDPRADRLYGEFYQLDLEMSFVEDGEEVRTMMDPLIASLVTDFASKKLLNEAIPRIPYAEAMEKYGTDKPDLRYGMELTELSDALTETEFSVFKNAEVVKAICVKNGASLSRSQMDEFTRIAEAEGAGGLPYIKLNENGSYTTGVKITFNSSQAIKDDFLQALASPIAKFLSSDERINIVSELGAEAGDLIVFGADTRAVVNKVLGRLRIEFANHFELKDPNVIALCWIVHFPFYEMDEKTGQLDFGHNPFSMPKGGLEALHSDDKLGIIADQYDMVMNGYEICSGGVRNHNPEIMYKVFAVLGFDQAYVDSRFGAMINAFKYGAPPHAGCAFGIDRMLMELTGEDNIREVVAFPKNGSGVDTMMASPSPVDEPQLKDLSIKVIAE